MKHMPDAKASDMSGTALVHPMRRLAGKGKMSVSLAMNDVKEGRTAKPELGMTGKPTVTKTMARDFGRTHSGGEKA